MTIAIKGVDTTHHDLTGAMLKAAGKAFVCRYVQNKAGSTLDKQMRHDELVEKAAAGVLTVANWELESAPPNSRSRGQDDAHACKARLAGLGVGAWVRVYYSLDTPASASDYNAYAAGWRDVYPADQLGVYGDGALFRALKADGYVKYAWQSMSRSYPGNHHADGTWNHDGADIIQTGSGTLNGFSLDYDTAVVDDYGGFMLGEEDPMAVTDTDVATILHTDGIIPNPAYRSDSPAHTPPGTNAFVAWQTLVLESAINASNAVAGLNALKAAVAKIPTTAGTATLSDADKADIAQQVADLLAARLQN